MSEANKAIVKRYFEEIWSKGNVELVDELTGYPKERADRLKEGVTRMHISFPDIKYTVQELVAEGDKIMSYWTAEGTHKGEYRGIPATGKHITYRGFDLYRLSGGRIVERFGGFNDDLMLLQAIEAFTDPRR
ncbi:MAG: hypothetical protein EXR59_02450 [Dehalococcoidia bacterium]|nr:hypothetical protein [Dehalococcoidia bacterium]